MSTIARRSEVRIRRAGSLKHRAPGGKPRMGSQGTGDTVSWPTALCSGDRPASPVHPIRLTAGNIDATRPRRPATAWRSH